MRSSFTLQVVMGAIALLMLELLYSLSVSTRQKDETILPLSATDLQEHRLLQTRPERSRPLEERRHDTLRQKMRQQMKSKRIQQRDSVSMADRRQWPARNYSCYPDGMPRQEQLVALRQSQKRQVWLEWGQAFCRSLPKDDPNKNMSHELFQQLKCIQQGLDAIGLPMFLSGGTVIGYLTVRGMNMYEVDNDVVVPSWFDFEALQDYWSDLPETDVCSDMIIWEPDGMLRACMGIRDREKDCEKEGDPCSQIYRPYSDIYSLQPFESVFDVSDENGMMKHWETARQTLMEPQWKWISDDEKRDSMDSVYNSYRNLFFGEKPIPFVNESEMKAVMSQKQFNRDQAYEWHVFTHLLERQSMGGVDFSVMRSGMNEYLCHYKYGYNNWWNYPDPKNIIKKTHRTLDTCNNVYADEYLRHKTDRRIRRSPD